VRIQQEFMIRLRLLRQFRETVFQRPMHFAKYRPASRLGTRRIEQRLLRRLRVHHSRIRPLKLREDDQLPMEPG
jgi:hypothetical protein